MQLHRPPSLAGYSLHQLTSSVPCTINVPSSHCPTSRISPCSSLLSSHSSLQQQTAEAQKHSKLHKGSLRGHLQITVATRGTDNSSTSRTSRKSSSTSSTPPKPSSNPLRELFSSSRNSSSNGTSSSGRGTVSGTRSNRNGTGTSRTQTGTGTSSNKPGTGTSSSRAWRSQNSANKASLDRFYLFFTGFPFPIGPVFERNTVRTQVEPDVWIFEQTQAIENFAVYTPVRMTVIRLKSGGLWVHNPLAPTQELVRLVKELGEVEYIVLGTFAYEHKVFVAPFSRKFPKAEVYVTPYQWSFPINLPPQLLGIFPTGELQSDDPDVPWAGEIDQKVFLPPTIGIGDYVRFTEVAFFHRRSRTLLVTDACVYIPLDPPAVIPAEALIENGRDNFLATFVAGGRSKKEVDAIKQTEKRDTKEARRRGWARMVLLVTYFNPFDLLTPEASINAIANRLLVAPVVEQLVYSKLPRTVRKWVTSICDDWNFKQIIPAHFAAPIKAGPADLRRAFAATFQLAAQLDAQDAEQAREGGTVESAVERSRPRAGSSDALGSPIFAVAGSRSDPSSGEGTNLIGDGMAERGSLTQAYRTKRQNVSADTVPATSTGRQTDGTGRPTDSSPLAPILSWLGSVLPGARAAADGKGSPLPEPIPFPEGDMRAINFLDYWLVRLKLVRANGDAKEDVQGG